MRRFAFVTFCTVFAFSASIPNAQSQDSGAERIITKKPSIKILDLLEKSKVVGELQDKIYMVTTDEEGWLCVPTDSGVIGWFEKADAVLVDDAVKFFTQRINADKTTHAPTHVGEWFWASRMSTPMPSRT